MQYFALACILIVPLKGTLHPNLLSNICFSEYHFTNREAMQQSIDAGNFIESAVYNENLYGTR